MIDTKFPIFVQCDKTQSSICGFIGIEVTFVPSIIEAKLLANARHCEMFWFVPLHHKPVDGFMFKLTLLDDYDTHFDFIFKSDNATDGIQLCTSGVSYGEKYIDVIASSYKKRHDILLIKSVSTVTESKNRSKLVQMFEQVSYDKSEMHTDIYICIPTNAELYDSKIDDLFFDIPDYDANRYFYVIDNVIRVQKNISDDLQPKYITKNIVKTHNIVFDILVHDDLTAKNFIKYDSDIIKRTVDETGDLYFDVSTGVYVDWDLAAISTKLHTTGDADRYRNYWRNDKGEIVISLINKHQCDSIPAKYHDDLVQFKACYDIVFVSNREPCASQNYSVLLSQKIKNKIHLVTDSKSIQEAYKKAAEVSTTENFFIIDADNFIIDFAVFDFFIPSYDAMYVHIFKASNSLIDDLVYGYGAIKILNKQMFESNAEDWIDFTQSLIDVFGLKEHDIVASETIIDSSDYETWKNALREMTKLILSPSKTAKERLFKWRHKCKKQNKQHLLDAAYRSACELVELKKTDQINNKDYLMNLFSKYAR